MEAEAWLPQVTAAPRPLCRGRSRAGAVTLVRVHACARTQGDWLIEVPKAQLQRVPRTWHQVCATQKVRGLMEWWGGAG